MRSPVFAVKKPQAKIIVRLAYPRLRHVPMRISPSRPLALALIAILALPVAGCAGRGGGLKKGDVPYVARDVGTLYSLAKHRLDQGRYKESAVLFDEVERQHPYSVWARRAQLMSAFSYYMDQSYTDRSSRRSDSSRSIRATAMRPTLIISSRSAITSRSPT